MVLTAWEMTFTKLIIPFKKKSWLLWIINRARYEKFSIELISTEEIPVTAADRSEDYIIHI